ncbi:flagellar basal body rod protein FlgB [Clostridium sp.]|uniref:flagellar basal body rod protein FlgB n=1 Tax=Clostridium sp. TaxID=1506 RepID=UPI001B683549|nr:flagellar basal body rod protein FlgB [Clostridium sp.]MBP3914467.1 flagellar basal body rod protein FlgB [Clostridium sp.]
MLSVFNNDNTYNLIQKGLNVASLRSEVISNNIANVNTKNFKRSSVSFEENLMNKSLEIKKSNEKHISNKKETVSVEKDYTTSMKSDGNNVDIDLEKVDQAANSLMYNALISSIRTKFNTTSTVIQGGK